MKKTKLFVEHQYDFELLGLVASLKDYKMAWIINKTLGLSLIKSDDFEPEFLDHSFLQISQYYDARDHGFFQLLRNRSYSDGPGAVYLIPELKAMDYFLLIQDDTAQLNINAYIERLTQISLIQNVVKLDITKIKSRENLLTY